MIEDLANDGAEFVNELLNEVRSIKNEKRWKEVMTPRSRLKFGNFSYNTQTGTMGFDNTSWELEMKATLDQTLQNEIIKNIKDKGAYMEFQKKIANRRNIPETGGIKISIATLKELKEKVERLHSEDVLMFLRQYR